MTDEIHQLSLYNRVQIGPAMLIKLETGGFMITPMRAHEFNLTTAADLDQAFEKIRQIEDELKAERDKPPHGALQKKGKRQFTKDPDTNYESNSTNGTQHG